MPNITFSNPQYKDRTVYAVAGSHTENLLKIAQKNHISIDFNCEDGECGTCIVKVTSLEDKPRMGCHLTEKEKSVLREHGKLTKAEIEELTTKDLPSTWRLACQMIVRDEDILIEY